jgi:hypothetical protein
MPLFALILGFLTIDASAAPCCAGSNAIPSLISGDEAELYQFGISSGQVIGDAPGAGAGLPVFRDSLSPAESRQSLVMNHARLLDRDRFQAGVSLPLLRNEMTQNGTSESHWGLGDVSLTLGYETLPEWEYSKYQPRIFSFLQTTLPTGRSLYESRSTLGTDVTGLSQWQLALGSLAVKRWSSWDANGVLKFGHAFGRDFGSSSGSETLVSDSWLVSGSLGAGLSFRERFRAGSSLSFDYQSPVEAASRIGFSSRGSQRLIWNAGLSLTYLSGFSDSVVLAYQDQTWFGPAINASLSRTLSFSFAHRIER